MNQIMMETPEQQQEASRKMLARQIHTMRKYGVPMAAIHEAISGGATDFTNTIARLRVYGKPNKYLPHQGKQECKRRFNQMHGCVNKHGVRYWEGLTDEQREIAEELGFKRGKNGEMELGL